MIATGQYADVGRGIRLHYASVGRTGARPMVFLHGFPEYSAAWEDVLPPQSSPTPEEPGPAALRLDPAQFQARVPTLILWGEADTALPPRLLDGLVELVDGLRIERLPNATHWLAHEEPQRVAEAIRSYCRAA